MTCRICYAPAVMPEATQKVTALAEIKPFDIATLIAPPAEEETAPEAEPEAEETTEQAAEKSETEETGSMCREFYRHGSGIHESPDLWLRGKQLHH